MKGSPVISSWDLYRVVLHTKKRVEGLMDSKYFPKSWFLKWHAWQVGDCTSKMRFTGGNQRTGHLFPSIRDILTKDCNALIQDIWKAESVQMAGLKHSSVLELDITNGGSKVGRNNEQQSSHAKKKQWWRIRGIQMRGGGCPLGLTGLWCWGCANLWKPAKPRSQVWVCHRWQYFNPDLYLANPYPWPIWVLLTCGNP